MPSEDNDYSDYFDRFTLNDFTDQMGEFKDK